MPILSFLHAKFITLIRFCWETSLDAVSLALFKTSITSRDTHLAPLPNYSFFVTGSVRLEDSKRR